MAAPESTSPLVLVPEEQAPVRVMLSDHEKQFLDMLATSFFNQIISSDEYNRKNEQTGTGHI